MAISVETVAVRVLDIEAGVEIPVNYPLFAVDEVFVYYGKDALLAQYNVDYTVELDDENFDTFSITPTSALLDKIDALIVADPEHEINYVTIRRSLDNKTDATPAGVRYTPFTSREFERTIMRFQQTTERLSRAIVLAPSFVGGNEGLLQLTEVAPNRSLAFDETGTRIVPGPTMDEVENAQENAEAAIAAKNEALAAKNTAVEAKDTAVASANTATNAKNVAVAAKDDAVAAAASAMQDADDAVAAALDAEAAANAAAASESNSAASETVAVAAKNTAVAAKDDAVTAKGIAETARDEAVEAALDARPGPIGSVIMIYGDDTSVAPGYLLMSGFSVTNTYPDLRAHGLAHGWEVDGNGDPICPDMGGYFPRGWKPGQVVDSGRVFGSVQNDAIRNITGSVSPHNTIGITSVAQGTVSGAFKKGASKAAFINPFTGAANDLEFDASQVVPTADENRPYNRTFTFWIKAYAADTDPGAIDLNGVVNDTNALKARVTALEGKKGTTGVLALSTAQFDITGIPTDARHIKLKLAEVSLSAGVAVYIQLGTAAGVETSGYKISTPGRSTSGTNTSTSTAAIVIALYSSATGPYSGIVELERVGNTNNWVATSLVKLADSAGAVGDSVGFKAMTGGALDRLRITTAAGTATLSGNIEIEWEK